MFDGAGAAAGFYLGLKDDVTPKLKGMRKSYARFLAQLLHGNEKIQKSINKMQNAALRSAGAGVSSSAMATGNSPGNMQRRFKLTLESEKGPGLFRKLFGELTKRVRQQRFLGQLTPFAKGGVVTRPTAALIGENNKKEAVLPLDKIPSLLSDIFGPALRSAGGAAKMPMNNHITDALVQALVDSEAAAGDMVRFMAKGARTQKEAVAQAARLAGLFADAVQSRFKTTEQREKYVAMLTKQLIPAMQKGRDATKGTARHLEDIDKRTAKMAGFLKNLTILGSLEMLSRAVQSAAEVLDSMSTRDAKNALAARTGMAMSDVRGLMAEFRAGTGKNEALTSSRGKMQAVEALSAAGMRQPQIASLAKGEQTTVRMMDIMASTGIALEESAGLVYDLNEKIGLTSTATEGVTKYFQLLSQTNAIGFEDLREQVGRSVAVFQGAMSSMGPEAKATFMSDLGAITAAVKERARDFDVAGMLESLTVSPDAMGNRALVASRIGISTDDLTAKLNKGDVGSVVNAILADIQNVVKTTGDASIAAQILTTSYGGAADAIGLGTGNLIALGKEGPGIVQQYTKNTNLATTATEQWATTIKDVIPTSEKVKNVTQNLAENIGFGNANLGTVIDLMDEFDLPRIAAGLFVVSQGLGMVMKPLAFLGKWIGGGAIGGLLKAGGFLFGMIPGLGKVGGLVAGLGAKLLGLTFGAKAAATAAEGVGKSVGQGLGDVLARVGKGLGSFVSLLAKGLATGIRAVLMGIGQGLLMLAPGLLALTPAIPVMLTFGLGLVALGGAIWMVGKGLEASAPAITAVMGGISEIFTTTMTSILGMDPERIWSVARALPALGVGFGVMATGIVGGVLALTTGELLTKVASFFGLGNGEGLGERVANFVNQIAGIGPLMQQIAGSNLAGRSQIILPIPVFEGKIDHQKLAEVRGAYASLAGVMSIAEKIAALPQEITLPSMRVNPEELRKTMEEAAPLHVQTEDSSVVPLMAQMVELLKKIAGQHSGGGGASALSTLISNGGLG